MNSSQAYFNSNPFTDMENYKSLRAERELFLINQLSTYSAFQASTHNDMTFIFHKSTKIKGYQLSYFYKEKPVSDIQRATIEEISHELINCDYKIMEVVN